MIQFTVPFVPPSVNNYVRHVRGGRGVLHIVTEEAKSFKEAVWAWSRNKNIGPSKAYVVEIKVFLGYKQKGDVDNFPKLVLDGIRECGLIKSDAAVMKMIVEKDRDVDNPRTEIAIWTAEEYAAHCSR